MKDSGARPDHSQRNAAANKKTYRQKTGRHLPNDRNVFSKDTNGKTTACTKILAASQPKEADGSILLHEKRKTWEMVLPDLTIGAK